MPFNSCDPCCDPLAVSRSKETWKQGVLIALCNLVQAIVPGTLEMHTVSGLELDSGDTSIAPAPGVGKHIHVYMSRIMTLATTAVRAAVLDGLAGAEKEAYMLQTVSGLSVGGNIAVTPPGFLYRLSENTPLVLNLSSGQLVSYSFSYFVK